MKINEFLDQYNNTTDKEKFIKKIIFRHYVPYADKIATAENIIQLSSYDGNGAFRVNSPLRYILWVQAVIVGYTTLEIGDRFVDAYDALDQAGVIEPIMSAVGKDAESLQTIISMTLDDLIMNERDMPSYIDNKLSVFLEVAEAMIKSTEEEKDGAAQ